MENWMSVREAALFLSITPQAVYGLIGRGSLPKRMIAGHTVVDRNKVIALSKDPTYVSKSTGRRGVDRVDLQGELGYE